MPDLAPQTTTSTDDSAAELESALAFDRYLDDLTELLGADVAGRSGSVVAALNGQVAQQVRATVPLATRRRDGVFFTSPPLAGRLLAGAPKLVRRSAAVADPACGAGDLLLAAAQHLPVLDDVASTLESWGRRLVGRDITANYVRATRIRLALLAAQRLGQRSDLGADHLAELLSGVQVGDGTELELKATSALVLLNPPFGSAQADEPWGSGRVARAGVFCARIIDRLPAEAELRAVLPDVLRTGSNYARWRSQLESSVSIDRIEPFGQFDRWTDVDVFLLAAHKTAVNRPQRRAAWWSDQVEAGALRVGDRFEVRVGTVVPHRDAVAGPASPFLRARGLPVGGEHVPGAITLRHAGRRFTPPFVALRRTSRPSSSEARIAATLIEGEQDVLVENHLLVCLPADGSITSCRNLMRSLAGHETTAWFDQRLRCRHLTVSAVREAPLFNAETRSTKRRPA